MQRGKAAKKSSMRGKGGVKTSRSMGTRVAGKKTVGKKVVGRKVVGKKIVGKKIVGKPGVRTATGSRPGQVEEGSGRSRSMVVGGGRAGQKSRRPRKLDI